MAKKLKKPNTKKYGEDYLNDIVSIRIILENGEVAEFALADELHIPLDPDELVEVASKGPARLSFWAYQEQRALSKVRKLERIYDRKKGDMFLCAKQTLDEDTDFTYSSNDMVKGVVDNQKEVKKARRQLDDAREQYGILRSVREALEHYNYVTRRLLAQEKNYAN